MLLCLSVGSPCAPSRSPPPRWGSGESTGYVTRRSGDGGCTLDIPVLCQKQQKSPAFAAKTPPTPQNLIILLSWQGGFKASFI